MIWRASVLTHKRCVLNSRGRDDQRIVGAAGVRHSVSLGVEIGGVGLRTSAGPYPRRVCLGPYGTCADLTRRNHAGLPAPASPDERALEGFRSRGHRRVGPKYAERTTVRAPADGGFSRRISLPPGLSRSGGCRGALRRLPARALGRSSTGGRRLRQHLRSRDPGLVDCICDELIRGPVI